MESLPQKERENMNKFGTIAFEQGSITKTTMEIESIHSELPIVIISGTRPGKTVLITAGVHSCEYVGVETCFRLMEEYKPEELVGNLVIIPALNRTGFEARIPTLVPEDHKNLNRMFPGNANGTFSEKLADYITKNFFPDIHFYIDLHSGEVYEDLKPYIYYVGNCAKEVSEYAKGAAKLTHVDFMVKSNASTGCYNCAGMMGIPSLLFERGEAGRWSNKEIEENLRDIHNVLSYVGLVEDEPILPEKEPFVLEHPLYQNITTSGIWHTNLKAGDSVKVGQIIGTVSDYFGNLLEEVYAEHDGEVLYLTKTLWADKNTEVVCYATLCNGVECCEEHHIHEYCEEYHHTHKHSHEHIHDKQTADMESHFR
jgi:hypothetical protein